MQAAHAEMEAIKDAELNNSLGLADLCEKENKSKDMLFRESFDTYIDPQ